MSKLSIDETKAKLAGFVASLTSIGTALQADGALSAGPAAAQASRLIAYACAKQSGEMVKNISQSLEYMSPKPAVEGAADDILAPLVEIAEQISNAIISQFGIDKDAVAPFLVGTNDVMLPICESLLKTAVDKLAEADALTAAAASETKPAN